MQNLKIQSHFFYVDQNVKNKIWLEKYKEKTAFGFNFGPWEVPKLKKTWTFTFMHFHFPVGAFPESHNLISKQFVLINFLLIFKLICF